MMDIDYSSLSDHEISQILKDYGVDVGPINMATRRSYERKLHKLKTGETMAPTTKYEPVANDEDDEEVQFKSNPSEPRVSYQPPPSNVIHRTPEPTQTRQRRDPADTFSPHIDSRPSLNSARRTTRSYDPMVDRPAANPSVTTEQTQRTGGLPLWVKLAAFAVAVVLIYLIYCNMESNADTNIPRIPSKMEV